MRAHRFATMIAAGAFALGLGLHSAAQEGGEAAPAPEPTAAPTTAAEGLSGRVVDLAGEPSAGQTLTLLRGEEVVGTVVSGEDGAFTFAGVEPGDYVIKIGDTSFPVTYAAGGEPVTLAVPGGAAGSEGAGGGGDGEEDDDDDDDAGGWSDAATIATVGGGVILVGGGAGATAVVLSQDHSDSNKPAVSPSAP